MLKICALLVSTIGLISLASANTVGRENDIFQNLDFSKIKFTNPAGVVEGVKSNDDDDGAQFAPSIIGGNNASEGQFPYQLIVLAVVSSSEAYLCGGAFISRNTVLTAAHCVNKHLSTPERVGSFADILTLITKPSDDKLYRTKKINMHSDFQDNPLQGFPNDIATLITERPAELSARVTLIKLPVVGDANVINTEAKLAGFGVTSRPDDNDRANSTAVLKYATLAIVDNDICKQTFNYSLTKGQICVRDKANSSFPCMGDSGGALALQNAYDDKDFKHLGVVSFGYGYCEYAPTVFTKVEHYLDWIKVHTDNGATTAKVSALLTTTLLAVALAIRS